MKLADPLVCPFDLSIYFFESAFERWLALTTLDLFKRLEGNVNHIMDLLRGPAFGVIIMIFLLAGVILVTASAALVAQVGLVLRLKPWNTPQQGGNQRGPAPAETMSKEQSYAGTPPKNASFTDHPPSPQMAVTQQDTDEVIDAEWWQEVR